MSGAISLGRGRQAEESQLGGAFAGNLGEPLLVSAAASLQNDDKTWLVNRKTTLARVYVVGSTTSVTSTAFNAIKAAVAN